MSKIACIDAKIRANGCEENIDSKHAGLAAVTLAARGVASGDVCVGVGVWQNSGSSV